MPVEGGYWLRSGMLALMAGDLIDEVELVSVHRGRYHRLRVGRYRVM
jgi:hypothetical protein